MRSYGDDLCGHASAAVQRILLHIFSPAAVSNIAAFVTTLHEKGDLITTALVSGNTGGKQVDSESTHTATKPNRLVRSSRGT